MFVTVRRALQLMGKERRRRYLLVGALSIGVSLAELVSALMVLMLLKLVLDPGAALSLPVIGNPAALFPSLAQDDLVVLMAVVFGIFFLLRAGLFLARQHASSRVAENTGVLIAGRLVDGYLAMPYEFHLRRNSAEIIRNAYESVQQIVTGVFTPIADVFAEMTVVVAVLGVLLMASPTASLVAIGLIALIVLFTSLFIQPKLKRLGKSRQVAAKSAMQHLQQGLGGIRDIKVLGRERTFVKSFVQARQTMAKSQYWRTTLAYVPRTTIELTLLLVVLGILVWTTQRGGAASTFTTLGIFAYAGLRLQPSIQKIASGVNSIRFAQAAVEDLSEDDRLLKAASTQSPQTYRETGRISLRGGIVFDNVSFKYTGATHNALSDINLTIKHGESIGICGSTGAGKTTFIDLLCGLLVPEEGLITVDGEEIGSNLRGWQRSLAVVHQNSFLIDDTLAANIALGVPEKQVDRISLIKATQAAQLEDLVEGLPRGLDTLVGERGVRLSGGERQRVTLARALYRHPSLLILDEGTAALDNATEAMAIEELEKMRGNLTLVMVAHRLSSITGSDRIIYLEEGRVQGMGTYSELARVNRQFRTMAAH